MEGGMTARHLQIRNIVFLNTAATDVQIRYIVFYYFQNKRKQIWNSTQCLLQLQSHFTRHKTQAFTLYFVLSEITLQLMINWPFTKPNTNRILKHLHAIRYKIEIHLSNGRKYFGGKRRENTDYQRFLLFTQYFNIPFSQDCWNSGILLMYRREENFVEKEENAAYHHIILSIPSFYKLSSTE